MRNEKALIKMLRSLLDLLAQEAARNPAFAESLDKVLQDLPAKRGRGSGAARRSPVVLPDVHGEWAKRGEDEFRLWLRDQPLDVLRLIIRVQDFDPTRRTSKWKEGQKLADFIVERLRARLAKGSSFLARGES
jgi:hypothetical protein